MTDNNHYAIETRNLNIYYEDFQAVKDINLKIERNHITALIGPSGCGKSTVIRAFNRMNDFIPSSHTEGEVIFHGEIFMTRYRPSSIAPPDWDGISKT